MTVDFDHPTNIYKQLDALAYDMFLSLDVSHIPQHATPSLTDRAPSHSIRQHLMGGGYLTDQTDNLCPMKQMLLAKQAQSF
jgi:hypothetical protein